MRAYSNNEGDSFHDFDVNYDSTHDQDIKLLILKYGSNTLKLTQKKILEEIKSSIDIENEKLFFFLKDGLKIIPIELTLYCIENEKIKFLNKIIEKSSFSNFEIILDLIYKLLKIEKLDFEYLDNCIRELHKKISYLNEFLPASLTKYYSVEVCRLLYVYYVKHNEFSRACSISFDTVFYEKISDLNIFRYACNNPFKNSGKEFYIELVEKINYRDEVDRIDKLNLRSNIDHLIKFLEIIYIYDDYNEKVTEEDSIVIQKKYPCYFYFKNFSDLQEDIIAETYEKLLNDRILLTTFKQQYDKFLIKGFSPLLLDKIDQFARNINSLMLVCKNTFSITQVNRQYADINSIIWLHLGEFGHEESMLAYVYPVINAMKHVSSGYNYAAKILINICQSAISWFLDEHSFGELIKEDQSKEIVISKFNFRQRLLNELYAENNQPYR